MNQNHAFASLDTAGITGQLKKSMKHTVAIIDSGVTSHFHPDHSKFINFTSITPQKVHTVDGLTISAIGCGDV